VTVLADTPSLGLVLGLPLALLAAAGFLGFAVLCRLSYDPNNRYDDSRGFSIAATIVAVLLLIGAGACMWPWEHDYHFWKPVTGRVEKISNRFVGNGDGTDQKFVVVVGGQPYAVNDTRAALVHVGDVIHMRCKRSWQWAANSGWDCNWGAER
jgi:hypothetical protein